MWIETVCFTAAVLLAAALTIHPYTSPFASMPAQPGESPSHENNPGGNPFRFLKGGPEPVAWPCNAMLEAVIDMSAIHPTDRPSVITDLEIAFESLADNSPYSMTVAHVIEGTTTQGGLGDLLDTYGADLLVTFVRHGQTDLLSPHAIGTGGFQSNGTTARHGWIAFSADAYWTLQPGPGPYTRHALIVHEMLHALNLAHVENTSSVMHPRLSQGPGKLGAGNIAGLEMLNDIACSR
jgi:hypothetical protein